MPPKKMNKLEPVLLNYPLLEMMKQGNDEEHLSIIHILSYLDSCLLRLFTLVPLSLDNRA